MTGIEVKEESAERELEEKAQVKKRELEKTGSEGRSHSEEVVNLVIGGELEVHEPTAETEAAAQSFVGFGLQEASQERSLKSRHKRGARDWSLLRGNLV